MRRLLMLVSVLLLSACWALAQNAPSSQTTPESGSSGQMGSSHSGHMSVEGCLSGSNGNYTLTSKNGMTYQLTGDTSKLSEHVGHEVKVTGTQSASGSTGATGGTAAGTNEGSRSLEVTSVKHISKTCQNAGGMAK